MGNEVQCTFITPVLKKSKGTDNSEDSIDRLPDEILISILSLLTITEAASTSVLSHRWETLWEFSTGTLDFDSSKLACDIAKDQKLFAENNLKLYYEKTLDYMRWVHQVCMSHKGTTIEKFRLCFYFDQDYRCIIDKWIEFEFSKQTRALELDFTNFEGFFPDYSNLYTFPHGYYVHHMQSPLGVSQIRHLKSLSLTCVNVSGEHLEYLLSNCPLLEELCVRASQHLKDFKVAPGSSLQLKHLEITYCQSINLVEISASNLESLIYMSQVITGLHIKYAPRLVDVTVCAGFDREPIIAAITPVSSYLIQLETLTLQLREMRDYRLPQLPLLNNLRNLTWIISATGDRHILYLTSLIDTSPFLQKLTFEGHLT